MKRLRILMVNHHRISKIHFVYRSLAMAKHLVRLGHHVTVLTTADQRKTKIIEYFEEGIHIVEIPDLLWGSFRSGWDPWSALNRLLYLWKIDQEFDLIHLFESRPAVIHPVQLYRAKRRVPLIIDWVDGIGRGGIMEVRRPGWYRWLLGGMETFYEEYFRARADGLTVICTALNVRAQGLGILPKNILQIPIGVDLDIFPAVLNKADCRTEVGLPQEAKIITFASVDADFDLPHILDSMVPVFNQHSEARLMIMGKLNPLIQNLTSQLGIADRIVTTGYIPTEHFPKYLGCADVFLLPFPNNLYNVGRWPSKIGDYMASGRPIISNPTGDIKALFESQNIGLLADETSEDFSAKINFILSHPAVANELGKNARQTAVEKYAWGILVKDLENFYFKTLNRGDYSG